MPRNLKALGLALVAVLAMSAVVASAAQANDNFTAATYPATLSGTAGFAAVGLDAFGTEVTCPETKFSAPLAGASETLVATPTFPQTFASPCHVGTLPATVTINACKFRFHMGATTAGVAAVTSDLTCETGDVEIDVYASEAAHTAGTPICHITFKGGTENQGLTGGKVKNGTNDLVIEGAVEGIHVTQVRTSAIACPTGTVDNNGKFTVKTPITVTGTHEGAADNIDIG